MYGHRKDARGFAGALQEIDARVAVMLGRLRQDDLLIVTADHGVDMAQVGTDHTREYAPLLAVSGEMLAAPRAARRWPARATMGRWRTWARRSCAG